MSTSGTTKILKKVHRSVSSLRKKLLLKRPHKYWCGYNDALREVSNLLFIEILSCSNQEYLKKLADNSKNRNN